MKRYFVYLLVFASFGLAITGCKKQTIVEEEIIITDSVDNEVYPDPVVSSTGLVVGKVMPETKYTLLLYNNRFSYSDYEIMNRTGAFVLKNVKAGEYTLLIQSYDPDINPFELTKIAVDSGRTTNLGLILLP